MVLLIDSHTHIFPPHFGAKRWELLDQDQTFASLYSHPEKLLASAIDLVSEMDLSGIDISVAAGIGWTDFRLARQANDYVIASVRQHPDRLIGLCAINPLWGAAAIEEIYRCADAGLRGIGELHPDSQGFQIDDAALLRPVMTAAADLGLPVLVHSSEPVGHLYPGKGKTHPYALLEFIKSFQSNDIICAHWGGGLPFYTLMPEVRDAFAKVYFDSAASPFLYSNQVYEIVDQLVGTGKLLFGTDFPLLRQKRVLEQIRGANLSDEAKGLLTGGNAAKLFRLEFTSPAVEA